MNKCNHQWETTRVEDAHSKAPLQQLSKCTLCERFGVKVIVVRVGHAPVVEVIAQSERRGGHLEGMQAIVCGMVEVVYLADPACPGLELWCNEDGIGLELPLNRVFGATPRRIPAGFEDAFVIDCTDGRGAKPGEPGVWEIIGDFFLARTDEEGDLAPTNDADLAWALATFPGENPIAAAVMDAMRPQLQRNL